MSSSSMLRAPCSLSFPLSFLFLPKSLVKWGSKKGDFPDSKPSNLVWLLTLHLYLLQARDHQVITYLWQWLRCSPLQPVLLTAVCRRQEPSASAVWGSDLTSILLQDRLSDMPLAGAICGLVSFFEAPVIWDRSWPSMSPRKCDIRMKTGRKV